MNYKLLLAYEGSQYAGWQKTASPELLPTIEGTLQRSLETLLQHPVALQAASRTDRGVHAQGQVVNFFTQQPLELSRFKYRLNSLLPKDIALLDVESVPQNFHPTLDAVRKEYWYDICHGPIQLPFHQHTSWHYPYLLNKQEMKEAAAALLGSQDFSSFCNERPLWDRSPLCHLQSIEIADLTPVRLRIHITADHFLYRMARNIAGTLAYVGSGKLKPSQIPEILKSLDRTQSGPTAPAHGLKLQKVFYAQ